MEYQKIMSVAKKSGLIVLVDCDLTYIDGVIQRNMFFKKLKNDFVIITNNYYLALEVVKKYLGITKFFIFKNISSINWLGNFEYSYIACVNKTKNISDFDLCNALQENAVNSDFYEITHNKELVGYLKDVSIIKRVSNNKLSSFVEEAFIRLNNWNKDLSKVDCISNLSRADVLVTSFYTEDEYYSDKARELIQYLDLLGVRHDIRPFKIPEGMKWPDVCRKKVGYYYNIFMERRNDFKKLIWIDVDCKINFWPSFIEDFDVDFMAFRRGFPHSSHKERNLSRHWEPCFFVFNNTNNCLKLLEDANKFEKESPDIPATDDYFFEESWRKNGSNLSVFEIPGEMSSRGYKGEFQSIQARSIGVFFSFGESGHVAEFKGKVIQHEKMGNPLKSGSDIKRICNKNKELEYLIDIGKESKDALRSIDHTIALGCSENNRELAKSLYSYEFDDAGIPLFWWIRPAPGNMGDWLSPYIMSKVTNRSVYYSNSESSRLVALGSIAKFAKDNDYVWGSGISARDTILSSRANYIAVRGPYTATAVKAVGGVVPEVFGDPGILMPSLYMPNTVKESGRFGLVRHFVHQDCPIELGEDIIDINILMSSAYDIENFIDQLYKCEAIVTTSLHVMILCLSYNIPCRLINIEGEIRSVHGDGIKYRDFYEGVGLDYMPHIRVKNKITSKDILSIVADQRIDPIYMINLRNILYENLNEIRAI